MTQPKTHNLKWFLLPVKRAGFLLMIIVLSVSTVWSDESSNSNSPKLSVDEAVNMVRSQYADGKILKTTTENNGNQTIYVIKVITADSRVLHITVDAQSGQISQ